ncbi:P-loop containing nucleoside triphosphate hydrolase [Gracilaria domingensis]|nr:P-loop containing nucleoside triphosphate hydrolase [Gracilaria domingensis]
MKVHISATRAFSHASSRRSAQAYLQNRKQPSKLLRPLVVSVFLILILVLLLSSSRTHPRYLGFLLGPNSSGSEGSQVYDDQVARAARHARPFPECSATSERAKSFLIVFMGHSGSSAVLSELRSHSQVYMEIGELVDHQPVFNSTAALETTTAFFERGLREGKLPGFKIRPTHILNKPNEFRKLAEKYQTRILWNYRRNLFKASVGEYSHRYLNDTAVVEGLRENVTMEQRCQQGAGCRFRIDNFQFLHDTIRNKVRSHHAIIDAVHVITGGNGCVREVLYEDYLYDRENVMRDIQTFLGLPYEQTQPSRFKATGDNLCKVVQNWDQLCHNFYGCFVWQKMLEDARNDCFCKYSSGPTKYCSIELVD